MSVHMDLDDKFIRVTFDYNPTFVSQIKGIPGVRFNNGEQDKTGPHWRIPIDIDLCHMMRSVFGENIVIEPKLREWAKHRSKQNSKLTELALSDTAELDHLHKKLPKLYEAIHLGPAGLHMDAKKRAKALKGPPSFQAADVKFIATSDSPMNCNQPGLGKTLETIAAVYEGGDEQGSKLVVAPLTSLETVWGDHLNVWQEQIVIVAPPDRKGREAAVAAAREAHRQDMDFWFVINPAMVQYRNEFRMCDTHKAAKKKPKVAELKDCFECELYLDSLFPDILDIDWEIVILDEFHKMGMGNSSTLSYKALRDIKCRKRIALSGTPMGGKPIKMFGILSFLFPDEFTSKWRFADTWLEISSGYDGHKSIEGLKPGLEEDFYKMLSRYMIRRTKRECLPWLPEKQWVNLELAMTPGQGAQYEEFAELAEIRIDEEELSATSVLAEYTRLKQFAMAKQTILGRDHDGKLMVKPTTDSNKLPYVIDLLNERGIRPGDEAEGDEQVVIFSQFSQVTNMVCDELQRLGYPADRITGDVGSKERTRLTREFQSPNGSRVLCMTTTAGGVAITLDRASTVIFLDETWNPDDQEQAEDRCHRGSRLHQVTIYYLRSKKTIEQYIQETVTDKSTINKDILDLRRQGLRSK